MKNTIFNLIFFLVAFSGISQLQKVAVNQAADGTTLVVNGEDFIVNGMNWDYFPIGTNYSFSLWNQTDDFIKAALDAEMGLLKNMGVNTIRTYTGIQPRWITYIYENYGIYTILNHSFGRYGLTIDGAWVPVTDYRNEKAQTLLMSEVTALAKEYTNTLGCFYSCLETKTITVCFGQALKRKTSQTKKTNAEPWVKTVEDLCTNS